MSGTVTDNMILFRLSLSPTPDHPERRVSTVSTVSTVSKALLETLSKTQGSLICTPTLASPSFTFQPLESLTFNNDHHYSLFCFYFTTSVPISASFLYPDRSHKNFKSEWDEDST